ncbi:hypothetical protein [uncultured Marivirga sp.]|uniref:hypothetical protein n=1 Tax=uncultured Marivirga sp. TaxID=1123707 RepID=UPI0030EF4828
MKQLILIKILILIYSTGFSQNLSEFLNISEDFKNHLDWSKIELSLTDAEIQLLKNKTQYYKLGSFTEAKSDSEHHFCDLNKDGLIDLALVYFNGVDYGLSIYLNNGDSLIIKERINGRLSSIKSLGDITQFSIVTYLESISPLPTKYSTLLFIPFFGDYKMVNSEVIRYHTNFKFPKQQVANYTIRILNPKYRLRSSPAIQEDNVIAELEKGRIATVFAESEDETGRTWIFVSVDTPSIEDGYFHTDDRNSKRPSEWRSLMHLGWISKRYVEIVNIH